MSITPDFSGAGVGGYLCRFRFKSFALKYCTGCLFEVVCLYVFISKRITKRSQIIKRCKHKIKSSLWVFVRLQFIHPLPLSLLLTFSRVLEWEITAMAKDNTDCQHGPHPSCNDSMSRENLRVHNWYYQQVYINTRPLPSLIIFNLSPDL